MKILVLENNPVEIALIQQALHGSADVIVPIASCEEIWKYIQSGEAHFLIANWDTSDLRNRQFIPRVRAMEHSEAFYILLVTGTSSDEDLAPSGADDTIQKPFRARDLKDRITLAERVISLSNNLASAHNQLENQAVYDSLTGFMNRTAFFRQANGELERARRISQPVSLIAIDIDNFKIINDSFGSNIGDEVLRMTARSIREKSRPYDCIGRWMGDEFILMLTGVIGADAEKIADRIIAGVRGTRIEVPNEPPLMVKVSAGVASASHINSSTEIEPLIQKARQAMAQAKQAGGNRVFLVFV